MGSHCLEKSIIIILFNRLETFIFAVLWRHPPYALPPARWERLVFNCGVVNARGGVRL